jgi:hypothetical protein
MMQVRIQRISLASLGKIGCLLGIVAAFLPSLLCGLLGLGLARLVLEWLGSWQELSISVLGQELARFDLVQFLGLQKVLVFLENLTAASGWAFLLAALLLALAAGIVLAAIIALVGLAYNLLAATTGGLVVEMTPVRESEQEPDTAV